MVDARATFRKPEERNPQRLDWAVDYKKRVDSYSKAYLNYAPSSQEMNRHQHWINKSDHSEHVHAFLTRATRVKLRDGMFEDDEGKAVNGPKSALVLMVREYVDSEKSLEMGNPSGVNPLSVDHFVMGRYERPKTQIKTDSRGNIVDSIETGRMFRYYIEDTRENREKYLAMFSKHDKFNMAVAIANPNGGSISALYKDSPRSVHNEKEFIEIEDIEGLIQANIGKEGKTYLTKEFGGYLKWKADREIEDKKRQDELDRLRGTTTSDNQQRQGNRRNASNRSD